MIEKLKNLGGIRAIEVGCGGCEVTRDLLKNRFDEIHFLDQCK